MNDIDTYLQNIPMINPRLDYQVDDGKLVVYFKHQSRIQRILRKLGFKIPEKTTLDFDPISQFVFEHIDGKRNIHQIGQLVSNHFGDAAEPLYERLVTYIDFLESEKRWVLFVNKMK